MFCRQPALIFATVFAWSLTCFIFGEHAVAQNDAKVRTIPESLVASHQLDRKFYEKYVDSGGIPIVASKDVADQALLEADWIINQMLVGREDIRRAIASRNIRVAIMSVREMTTDIPEHSTLKPAAYWDMRARGLGATRRRPAVSCGEENLLQYPGDPYRAENIMIHEFAHVIHQHGLNAIDPKFDSKLRKLYRSALAKGLWEGKYAGSNHSEYFAEIVQSWFGTNRENDHDHNHVNTRRELKEYDPDGAKLLESIFGANDWTYVGPSTRTDEVEHLKGLDRAKSPKFRWPDEVAKAFAEHQRQQKTSRLERLNNLPESELGKSITSGKAVQLAIRNETKEAVSVEWIDFQGRAKTYGTILPGKTFRQSTYQGHNWRVLNARGSVVGRFQCGGKDCEAVVK